MADEKHDETPKDLMTRMVELLGQLVEQHKAANHQDLSNIQPWTVVAEDPDPNARRASLQQLMEQMRTERQSQSELLGHIACAQMALLKESQETFGSLLSEVRALREGLAIAVPPDDLASKSADTPPS